MRLEFFPYPFLIGLGAFAVLLPALRRRRQGPLDLIFAFGFWIYILIVVGLTLFPIPLPGASGAGSKWAAAEILSRANFIPFEFRGLFTLHPNVILHELVGNVLLTVPFGLGVGWFAPVKPRSFFLLALGAGLGIEVAQLLVSLAIRASYRGVDINDVLLNALGAWTGYALFLWVRWLKNRCMQWLCEI